MLDILAEFFVYGIINRTGRFKIDGDTKLSEGDEELQFQPTPAGKGHSEIFITQVDIDNLIRFKAGVYGGIHQGQIPDAYGFIIISLGDQDGNQ